MQWIRENLFLTCLAGALIVCIGGAYTIRSGQDAAFEKEDMDPRADISFRIGSLARSKSVNKAGLLRAQKRLEKIRRQRDSVVREASRWNKRNYSVLQLKAGDGKKTVAAFPYDPVAYQRQDLTSKFTNTYRKVLYGALARLDPTSWPVDSEIGELSVDHEKDILSRRIAANNRVKYAQSRRPKPAPGGDEEEPKKPEGVSDEDWYLYNLTKEAVSAKARADATEQLMLAKANAGSMFVSPETLAMVTDAKMPGSPKGPDELDVIFPTEVWKSTDAPGPKLWTAQLNLWITQDILAVIDATNDASLKSHGSNRTVPNAAIKLLRDIIIEKSYLMQSGEGNVNSALTKRATNTEYEIVEYKFAIIINTKYLPELMHNIITRGDHTVTKVSIEQLPLASDGNRYYGTDPVANVTIGGEVLFRADWTRKIMPLDTLKDALSSVLRKEDLKLIEQSGR